MKSKFILSFLVFGVISIALCQNTIELTFTAKDYVDFVQLDSIKVMNRAKWCDTVLYYPDTVLVLDYQVGIPEVSDKEGQFHLLSNYPNPVIDQTSISFYIPERDKVTLFISDFLGRVLIKTERTLDEGYHLYKFLPGKGSLFLLTVQWRESSSSLKILKSNSASNNTNSLEYLGCKEPSPELKAQEGIQGFLFDYGDELLTIGYTTSSQSGILDVPETNETYNFQFATNIPCIGTPTVDYGGQVYNTIQVFSQCWLKENLNVGTMIQGSEVMSDNGIKEKYCSNNEPDSCTKYGGLYRWDEMMQYTEQKGTQGICPPGWHIPTDGEWTVLEGAVDSEYGIGDWEWELWGESRGFDAGKNLKSTNGWYAGGNGTDQFDFSGLPGGNCFEGSFNVIFRFGFWWTSTENIYYDEAYFHSLSYGSPTVYQSFTGKDVGFSARCLKN